MHRASGDGQRLASQRVNAQAANTVTATEGQRKSTSGAAAVPGATSVTAEVVTFNSA